MFLYALDVLYNDCYGLYKWNVIIPNPTMKHLHYLAGYKY